MKKTWIVAASQKSARIFHWSQDRDDKHPLKLLFKLENPLARERNRNLTRHNSGISRKMAGRLGSTSHRTEPGMEPHEMAAVQFARDVGAFLQNENSRGKFDRLIVTAEPHFLGKLKGSFGKKLNAVVALWVQKDFDKSPSKTFTFQMKNALRNSVSARL